MLEKLTIVTLEILYEVGIKRLNYFTWFLSPSYIGKVPNKKNSAYILCCVNKAREDIV